MIAEWRLYVSLALSILAAGIYVFIGMRLWRRDVTDEMVLPSRSFALWWLALAGLTVQGLAMSTAARFGWLGLTGYVLLTHVAIAVLCVALWGLLYYLVFLFTGKRRSYVPITFFYLAYYLMFVFFITFSRPAGVIVDSESYAARLEYASPIEGPFATALGILLVGPQIAAAIGYASLWFRVKGRTQRYRIALVSLSIIVWFGLALVALVFDLGDRVRDWNVISRVIGLLATLALLMAYYPPAFIRRFGIESVAQSRAG